MLRDSYVVFEKNPAKCWEESFLLGNGTIGASVFGDTKNEKIVLNHDTLWSGYPRPEERCSDGKASLEKAKQLVREKKYLDADTEISKNFSSYAVDAYMPMGELCIEYLGEEIRPTGYKRTLDLRTAVADIKYKKGAITYKTKSFVNYPNNVFVWRTDAENGRFSVNVKLSSQLYSKVYTQQKRIFLEGECPVTSQQNVDRTDRKTLYFDEPEKRGIRFMCAVLPITDGNIFNHGCYFDISDASYLELRVVAYTSFNGYSKHPYLEGRPYVQECMAALEKVQSFSFDHLIKKHVSDHRKYFSRVSVDLGSSLKSKVPTSVRLAEYEKGATDKALPTLLFNYGRYLTIAGSRAGSQALNLQGIWNPHFFAPWHADYTVNINTEMNYFPTLAIGLPEMYQPMIDLIKGVSEQGVSTAKYFYDADGWVCHHNTDIWRNTQPVAGMAEWLFWNTCGAWLCHHLYEYYEYTLDNDYLKNTAYPIMRESARFYLSQLDDSDDGYRIVFPSTSPENRFKSQGGFSAVSETTEMTMAAVRQLFTNLSKAATLLGVSDDVTEKVAEELPKLRPPKIGKDGRLLEWYGEMEERELRHRHVSHLYGLHPGYEIDPIKTPDLAEAARKTLEVRGDDGTGWSLAWKSNFFARLHDGNHAFKLIKDQLRVCKSYSFCYTGGGGSYISLMCAHPPFQIDGNFGATSGIAEMLLQSDISKVNLLPARPDAWSNVSYKGLCAKGNRKVDLNFVNGQLTECRIYGSAPEKILLSDVDITDRFVYENGVSILK